MMTNWYALSPLIKVLVMAGGFIGSVAIYFLGRFLADIIYFNRKALCGRLNKNHKNDCPDCRKIETRRFLKSEMGREIKFNGVLQCIEQESAGMFNM